VVLYFIIARRPTRVVGAALIALAVFLAATLLVPGLAAFVLDTATFRTASSYSHIFDWRSGLVAFFEQPWGHGLGSSDQVAARFGRTPLTADNVFLGYAVDLGVLGLIAFLSILFTVGFFAWRLFTTAQTPEVRMVAATVLLTDVGLAFNGLSSSPFNSVFLAYNFFLLAGAAITIYRRRPAQEAPARSR
jgi:hypothetical protein